MNKTEKHMRSIAKRDTDRNKRIKNELLQLKLPYKFEDYEGNQFVYCKTEKLDGLNIPVYRANGICVDLDPNRIAKVLQSEYPY